MDLLINIFKRQHEIRNGGVEEEQAAGKGKRMEREGKGRKGEEREGKGRTGKDTVTKDREVKVKERNIGKG